MAKARAGRRSTRAAAHLVVMAKTPRAGAVKRRLAQEIGSTRATFFYRTCLANTLRRLAPDPRFRLSVAVAPDTDVRSRLWAGLAAGTTRMRQGGGDLGARMQRLFRVLPPGPAIIVGSDIPGISAEAVAKAFKLLGNEDAVFGAAPDGGYWLIGLRRSPRLFSPFAGVRWSSRHALADTLANLKGKRIAFAAPLTDVDEARGWSSTRGDWGRLVPKRTRS